MTTALQITSETGRRCCHRKLSAGCKPLDAQALSRAAPCMCWWAHINMYTHNTHKCACSHERVHPDSHSAYTHARTRTYHCIVLRTWPAPCAQPVPDVALLRCPCSPAAAHQCPMAPRQHAQPRASQPPWTAATAQTPERALSMESACWDHTQGQDLQGMTSEQNGLACSFQGLASFFQVCSLIQACL